MASLPRRVGAQATRVLKVSLITAAGSAAAIACGPRTRASHVPHLRHVLAPPLGELFCLLKGLLRVFRLCAGCGLASALLTIAAASNDTGVIVARTGCCEQQTQ
eukprot:CAMPEP_0115693212 /NCGR_PEP_ID=MMETSP0272-20121206/63606_1 /TAXON_ID=71861 /ORGANISM="Scrippsiella trochoidea, Strain CCMP3099" /LENGTH=103 /DNA_ID=CAMNT_0003133317 /DNA_START=333 /DNA_END=641 /DNA_ORIENTATION=+